MFLVMMEWTSEMSSVNFAMFRCVRVSMYNFLVFCMKVSADNAHSCEAHHWQHIVHLQFVMHVVRQGLAHRRCCDRSHES